MSRGRPDPSAADDESRGAPRGARRASRRVPTRSQPLPPRQLDEAAERELRGTGSRHDAPALAQAHNTQRLTHARAAAASARRSMSRGPARPQRGGPGSRRRRRTGCPTAARSASSELFPAPFAPSTTHAPPSISTPPAWKLSWPRQRATTAATDARCGCTSSAAVGCTGIVNCARREPVDVDLAAAARLTRASSSRTHCSPCVRVAERVNSCRRPVRPAGPSSAPAPSTPRSRSPYAPRGALSVRGARRRARACRRSRRGSRRRAARARRRGRGRGPGAR